MIDLERLDEALAVCPKMHGFPQYEFEECATIEAAARTYRDLANAERVEPDYEVAARAMSLSLTGEQWVRAIVDAAIGDKLLVDYPTEEARDDENLRYHADARRTEEADDE